MKVKWLGHAAFLITSEAGVKIITDPYQPGMFGVDYSEIDEAADIVVVSHDHPDHNYVKGVPGNPQVVQGDRAQEAKGIGFTPVASFHDDSGGSQRGPNNIFCFTVDGVRLCHMGDLGHTLSQQQVAAVGEVDVLLIPVAGNFTLDPAGAHRVIEQLKPHVAIPMHYRTDRCPSFPVCGVDDFLEGKDNIRRAGAAEVELKAGRMPAATEILVLEHAL